MAASVKKAPCGIHALSVIPHSLRPFVLCALSALVAGCSTADDGGGAPGPAGTTTGGAAGGASTAGAASVAGASTGGVNGGGKAGAANGGATTTAGATNGGTPTGGTAIGGTGGTGGSANGGASDGGVANGGNSGNGGNAGSGSMGCAGVTNAKFCQDWDKLGIGKPSGDFSVSEGVVVDSTKAFSGGQSLHFLKQSKPASGTPNIRFTKQFPLASNDMHGRVMLFMAQTPRTDDHWNFITSSNSGGTEWSIGGQYGNFELVCDPPDHGLDSKTAFPGGKWVCVQWEFKAPASGDTTFVTKVDGAAVDQGEFTGANSKGEKWKAGAWNNLKLGWEIFGSSDTDVEFWLDDVAFGEQVIPCPAR